MKTFVPARVVYSVLFYVLCILLVIVSKPSLVFQQDGSVKPFGVGNEKTVFPLGVFVVVGAIVSFYLFTLIDIIYQ